MRDAERPSLIFSYPEFKYTPTTDDLTSLTLPEGAITFTFLDADDNEFLANGDKVPIQSYLTLLISFTMPIPVAYAGDEREGCYIKY